MLTYEDVISSYIIEKNKLPRHALFALSALILFYRGKRGEAPIALNDDKEYIDTFASLWKQYEVDSDLETLVNKVLSNASMWGEDLTAIPEFALTIHKYLKAQLEKGMRIALISFLGE